MTIKEVVRYQTSDELLWRTLEQAEFWEKTIKLGVDIERLKDKYDNKPDYNMRNDGSEMTYYPVGRD